MRLEAASAAVPPAAPGGEPRWILRDLDAVFVPGESHLVLGPNGAGKTTLIRLLAGLMPPASGRVLLDGQPMARRDGAAGTGGAGAGAGGGAGGCGDPVWPRIAVLFEEPDPQFLTDSVEAEIAFGLESLALPPEEIRTRTAEALEAFGLAGFERRAPHRLSGGEKARTLLAAAMAARPRALLLDQSLAHLDPGTRRSLEARLVRDAIAGDRLIVRTHQDADPPFPGERLHVLSGGALLDASRLGPREVLDASDVPFPLAMRVSALLASRGWWQGELAMTSESLVEGLAARGASLPELRAAPVPLHANPIPSRGHGETVIAFEQVAWAPRGRGAGGFAIERIDLELRAGEITALIGGSGSGKTTLLKLAAGLLEPTAGSIRRAAPGVGRSRVVGLALEYPERQLFGRTVSEDVAAILWVDGVPAAERRERAREAMGAVGLDPDNFDARVPFTLSDGEKRRAALATLLADPPRALLLDEPTAGLDPEGRRALARVVRALSARGHAILLASHDLDFVSSVAQRVVILGREGGDVGAILGEGPPDVVWHDRALLERAALPAPGHAAVGAALRGAGFPVQETALDAESRLDALARELRARRDAASAGTAQPAEAGDGR